MFASAVYYSAVFSTHKFKILALVVVDIYLFFLVFWSGRERRNTIPYNAMLRMAKCYHRRGSLQVINFIVVPNTTHTQ